MTTYAYVVSGQVQSIATELPVTWNGVANFNQLDAATLANYGWYAVTPAPNPTVDPDTQYLGPVTYTVVAGGVQSSAAVLNLSASDLALKLAAVKTDLCNQVDGICNTKCNSGFSYPATNGKAYQSDPVAIQRMQASATAALAAINKMTANNVTIAGNLRWANPNQDFGWIAADNSFNTMDAPTMLDFFATAISIGQSIILYARSKKNAINAAADFPTLRAIDINAGWPY